MHIIDRSIKGQDSRTVGRAPSAVTTVAAESIPALRIVANADGVQTMSSLDIVEYINHVRKPGEAVLAHGDFLKKVPLVLNKAAGNFSSTYISRGNGKEMPCYNFPRKEAIRMAMSYSYDLQAAVLDAWDEAAVCKTAYGLRARGIYRHRRNAPQPCEG